MPDKRREAVAAGGAVAVAAAAMAGGEKPEVRGLGSMVHVKKLTSERRFEWLKRNYASISMSRGRPRSGHSRENIISRTPARLQNIPFLGGKGFLCFYVFTNVTVARL